MPYFFSDTYFTGCATEVIEELQGGGGGGGGEEEEEDAGGDTTTNDTTSNASRPHRRLLERIGVNLSEPGSILWFPRLVNAIEQQGGSHLWQVDLVRGDFTLDSGDDSFDGEVVWGDRLSDHNLEHFFGTVLPRHPSLTNLHFTWCRIDRHILRLLAEPMSSISVSSTPRTMKLTDLNFDATPLDRECALLIQRMLQRGGYVAKLVISHCRIDADVCRCICEGAAGSTQIRYMSFQESYQDGVLAVQSDTLSAALDPASPLTGFDVRAKSWTDDAVKNAVAALRTNVTLQHVQFVSFDRQYLTRHEARFEDLLSRYNYTLVDLSLPDGAGRERIRALLRRNERVRALNDGLQDRGYCVPHPAALWPGVLERIGTIPTLLYRFVRRGNTTALAEQLASVGAGGASRPTKRAKKNAKRATT